MFLVLCLHLPWLVREAGCVCNAVLWGSCHPSWLCYIDVLVAWRGTQEELDDFMCKLNSNSKNINFTFCFNYYLIIFLKLKRDWNDLKAYCEKNIPHSQPSYSGNYTGYPPQGQFLRIRRSCSDEFLSLNRFRQRGYPHRLLRASRPKAVKENRGELVPKEKL